MSNLTETAEAMAALWGGDTAAWEDELARMAYAYTRPGEGLAEAVRRAGLASGPPLDPRAHALWVQRGAGGGQGRPPGPPGRGGR